MNSIARETKLIKGCVLLIFSCLIFSTSPSKACKVRTSSTFTETQKECQARVAANEQVRVLAQSAAYRLHRPDLAQVREWSCAGRGPCYGSPGRTKLCVLQTNNDGQPTGNCTPSGRLMLGRGGGSWRP